MGNATDPTAGPDASRPGAEEEADLTGRTLGDFQLLRRLGVGGMGQVYLAEQLSLKRKVALKLLKPDLAANATALARFKAEAEAVARATHANIVQVYAIGELNGLHYMALEYVDGRNLRQFLEKKGTPELPMALSIMRQVAAALQRASELGLIHRDIKPENILLTRKGEVKVADFGLSRFADTQQPLNLTQSGVTMGTPLYMSPEQVEGKAIDARTDIYSFGVTCYHLLAGQPPFRGQTAFEVAVQHVQKPPPPLDEIRPDLPPEVSAIIHKMMAKDPSQRYQTGREIIRDVTRLRDMLASGTGMLAGPFGGATSPLIAFGPPANGGETPADSSLTQTMRLTRPRRRQPWLPVGGVLFALGVGLYWGWLHNEAVPPTPPSVGEDVAIESLFSAKKREKLLLDSLSLDTNPREQGDEVRGLKNRIELGLVYLKDRSRLGEASRFFDELEKDKVKSYRDLGKLGQAMMLAFRDEPKKSAESFQNWFKEQPKASPQQDRGPLWRSPSLWEMVSQAMNHNAANLRPDSLPKSLEKYRNPPRAKSAPAGKGPG